MLVLLQLLIHMMRFKAPEHIPNVWRCLFCFFNRIQESESFEDRGQFYRGEGGGSSGFLKVLVNSLLFCGFE